MVVKMKNKDIIIIQIFMLIGMYLLICFVSDINPLQFLIKCFGVLF